MGNFGRGPPGLTPSLPMGLLYIYLLEAIGDRVLLFFPRHAKINKSIYLFFISLKIKI